MSTAGPNAPADGRNVVNSGHAWTNPNNITADDASYATITLSAQTSDILTADFSFPIPSGSTIDGITLTVKGKVSSGDRIMYLYPDLAGMSATVTFTTTEQTLTTGGATSTFSHTWTTAQVNALVVDCFATGAYTGTISVNYMTATIDYTPAATGFKNLPLLGVGLINTLIHGLTLGLCSWRWRPFTRTQTRTAGVMA